jgi:hypothetical protein
MNTTTPEHVASAPKKTKSTNNGGRDISTLWSWFTEDYEPQKAKSATCKHCRVVVIPKLSRNWSLSSRTVLSLKTMSFMMMFKIAAILMMTKNSFSMKLTAPIAINKTYITLGF